jgi:type VI protein secretion system component VasF
MGHSLEMSPVRSDIKRILAEMKANYSTEELAGQYEKVELPLIFFVDFMIKESKLSFASEWFEMGRERNELAGDEKFFDLLDEELVDPSDAAMRRLAIFYTCIGLGFTGIYTGQPESIRRLMAKISARISGMMDADEKTYVCPEAYEKVDSRDFVEPPVAKLVGIGIVLVGLIIVWTIAYLFLFMRTSNGVAKALDTIIGYPPRAAESVDSDNN